MRVEISIAKDKATKMPDGSIVALKEEMTRRLSETYPGVEVIVKTASNDGLFVMRASDDQREEVSQMLQEVWESADDWFY
jgi:hypothetical protein